MWFLLSLGRLSPKKKVLLQWTTYTEAAGYRVTPEENQDHILVFPHPEEQNTPICLLADGAGGREGGKEAAERAVQTIQEAIIQYPIREISHPRTWCAVLKEADNAIARDATAGFTTIVALGIRNGRIYGASCGDSAALQTGTEGNFTVLTENQRKNPPIGSGSAIPVAFEADFQHRLLLMSDGVFDYVGMEAIAEVAHQNTAEQLPSLLRRLQVANSAGRLGDDFSVIAIEAATPFAEHV